MRGGQKSREIGALQHGDPQSQCSIHGHREEDVRTGDLDSEEGRPAPVDRDKDLFFPGGSVQGLRIVRRSYPAVRLECSSSMCEEQMLLLASGNKVTEKNGGKGKWGGLAHL